MKGADDGNAKFPEAAAAVVLRDQIDDVGIGVTYVNADRKIETAHFLIERVKIRIGDHALALDAAHEDAAGAVLRTKLQFLQGDAHIEQRQNANPAQPVLPLRVNIRCLLYTSDAADERSSVDLGGR